MFDLFDEATNQAYQSMSSNMSFALAIQKHAGSIFDDYIDTFDSVDGDLQDELGRNRLFYGLDLSTLSSDHSSLIFAPKNKVFPIKKYLKRMKKEQKKLLKQNGGPPAIIKKRSNELIVQAEEDHSDPDINAQ
jgi:hypothetical protein